MTEEIQPIEGHVYWIHSRNLTVAVWNGQTFVGIREKAGDRFLDSSEISWKIKQDLGALPDGIGTWESDFNRRDANGFILQNEALFNHLDQWEKLLEPPTGDPEVRRQECLAFVKAHEGWSIKLAKYMASKPIPQLKWVPTEEGFVKSFQRDIEKTIAIVALKEQK